MWPDEAATRYCAPRKRLMVLALVGDSTMISLGMIQHLQHGCHRAGQGRGGDRNARRTRWGPPDATACAPLYNACAAAAQVVCTPAPVWGGRWARGGRRDVAG